MTGTLAAAAPTITRRTLNYGQLSPMLLVFGAAVIGVLVEAFVPRRAAPRPSSSRWRSAGLVAAFVATILVASSSIFAHGSPGRLTAVTAVAVDRPTLFIQGTILVLALHQRAADRRVLT